MNPTIRLCDLNAGLFVSMGVIGVAGAAGALGGRANGGMAGHNQLARRGEIVEHER